MNESDLRSDVHYLGSSENKAWKKKKKKNDLHNYILNRLSIEVLTKPTALSTTWRFIQWIVLSTLQTFRPR